ncbi:DMT family transporter [Actinomadura harenae]|uniref:DMT family transporter n=1 Tax=Actinomadura harenae TaxID=2483351 RepID=A0A3M2M6K9_9ACTN|nr:DMT family transporter [Actinomadura harenae]RMI44493.1 DMT family transporter [Actinomadura harenae]
MTSPANTRDVAQAALAMSLVGSLTAVSAMIADYPVLGGQAVRYAGAAAILFAIARLDDRRTLGRYRGRPAGRDLVFLVALAATGLAAFNVCIVVATRDTSPATIGTVVATVPIVLALAGPLLTGRRPAVMTVLAACVVTAGAGLANGLGGGTVRGLLLSLGALGGEICFSLLAVPVLPRLGPIRTSAWSAALASPMLLVTGLITDGRHVLRLPTGAELAGLLYLTVIVTCAAFLLWYDALGRMGADRAGLFAGMIPVSAVATTMILGIATPRPAEIAGAALVAVGVVLGLRPPPARTHPLEPAPGRRGGGSPEPGRELRGTGRTL